MKADTGSSGDPAYLELLEEMKSLHIRKNAGYIVERPRIDGRISDWQNLLGCLPFWV